MADKNDRIFVYFIYYIPEDEVGNITLTHINKSLSQITEIKDYEIIRTPDGINFITKLYSIEIKKKNDNNSNLILFFNDKRSTKKKRPFSKNEVCLNRQTYIFSLSFADQDNRYKYIDGSFRVKESVSLKNSRQFSIFLENSDKIHRISLCKDAIKQIEKETKSQEKIEFNLFILIFRECYTFPVILDLFGLFKIESIEPPTYLDGSKFKKIFAFIKDKKNLLVKSVGSKGYENVKKVDIYKKFECMLLYFYRYCSEERHLLLEYLKDEKKKLFLYSIIVDNYAAFKPLNNDEIKFLIDTGIQGKNKKLESCLRLSDNINELVVFLKYIMEKINDGTIPFSLLSSKEPPFEMNLDEYASQKETDDIPKLFEVLEEIEKLNEKENLRIKYDELFNGYLRIFSNNIEKLLVLKEKVKEKIPLLIDSGILQKIIDSIHNEGMKKIQENQMNTIEILEFIQKDEAFTSNAKKLQESNFEFAEYLNLSELNNEEKQNKFISIYNSLNFNECLSDKAFDDFVEKVFDQVNSLDGFSFLFKLYPPDGGFKKFNNVREKLINKFSSLSPKEIFSDQVISIVNSLIKMFKSSSNKIEEIIKTVKNSFGGDYPKIYKDILNTHSKIIEQTLKKKMVQDLVSVTKDDEIVGLISSLQPSEGKEVFSTINKKIVEEDDLLSKTEKSNYNLFKSIVDKGYFNNKDYSDLFYIKKTRDVVEQIKNKFKEKNYKFQDAEKYFDLTDKVLKAKLIYVCLGNEEESENLFKENWEIIDSYHKYRPLVSKCLKYLSYFGGKKVERDIEKLRKMKENLEKSAKEFSDEIQNYKSFDYREKDIGTYYDFVDSALFKAIYDSFKNEYDSAVKGREKTLQEFNKFKQVIEEEDFKLIPKKYLNFLVKIAKEEGPAKIEKEFDIMKNKFKLEGKNTTLLQKKIVLLSDIEPIYHILCGIQIVIKEFNVPKTELSSIISKFLDKMRGEISADEIEENVDALKGCDIDIENETVKRFFTDVNRQETFINFLLNKNEKQLEAIKDFIGQADDTFLKEQDTVILNSLSSKFKKIKREFNKCNDSEFLKELLGEINKKNNLRDFNSCVNNYTSFLDLLIQIENKTEFCITKIKKIVTNSLFKFGCSDSSDKDGIHGDVRYRSEEKGKKREKIDFKELLELKEKASLKKGDNTYEEEIENFQSLVTEINDILFSLKELSIKGAGLNVEYKIEIHDTLRKISVCQDGVEDYDEIDDLEDEIDKLKKKINSFTSTWKEFYEKDYLLTFVSGRLISSLCTSMKSGEEAEFSKFSEFFFRKLTNNNYKKKVTLKWSKKHDKDDYFKDVFENIAALFKKVLEENNLTESDLIKPVEIIEKKMFGVYFLLCGKNELESQIVNSFKKYTGSIPIPNTVLFCSKDTIPEEVEIFLQRAISCKEKSLFCIINPEKMQIKSKDKLSEIITEYMKSEKGMTLEKMTAALIFFYDDPQSSVIETLKKECKDHKKDKGGIYLKEINEKTIIENVEVVQSNISGIGKSHYIKGISTKEEKTYLYFSIGGDFSKKDSIIRLQKLLKEKSNVLLHIDIQYTKNIELMRDFLFSILILRCWEYQDKIVYIEKDTIIKVELPNTFDDPLKDYKVLNMFDIKRIENSSRPIIEVDQNLTSDAQIVFNYLKHFDSLNDNNLYIKDVSPNYDNEPKIDCVSLANQECQDLLVKHLGYLSMNYYQINDFIKIMAIQIKSFCKEPIFFVNNIKKKCEAITDENEKESMMKARTKIISAFIKIVGYFTKGSYEDIIKEQNFTEKVLMEEGEGKESETSKGSVSFDKIDPSFIFFGDNDKNISIISSFKEKIKEEEKYEESYLSELAKESTISLHPYKSFNQIDFLKEIKKIFDLKNPVLESEEKSPKPEKEEKSLERIVDTYAFTADNFLKMILILLKVRAGVPVILMGETGCGKTFLTRTFFNLIGSKHVKTLNIHAGIDDAQIYKFMKDNDTLVYKNDNEKEKVWIFLDEINTCNSMGLISDMLCKRTILGEKIKSNVVFFAACNPYRMKKETNSGFGLPRVNLGEKQSKLNYTVLPLPHSLINYVLHFGHLASKDERTYIKSMIGKPMEEFIKDDSKLKEDMIEKATDLISTLQDTIRDGSDVSSVSLREVHRVVVFFKWFKKHLERRKESLQKIKQHSTYYAENLAKGDTKYILTGALYLSVYLCYYLRAFEREKRSKISSRIAKAMVDDFDNFRKFSQNEMNYIIDQIDIPEGIAKNKALKENLFALFACVNKKIPVFICGKPGCSKSLSVQLLLKSMRGETSENEMFKKIPRMFINSYQGSLTSTSEGILEVFKRTRDIIKSAKDLNRGIKKDQNHNKGYSIISTFFFDEMGLAEISPNNPLKVIHSELEYDNSQDRGKIAFIGISNWNLDAAKMNRGIFLTITEPNEKDLQETALEIAKSYRIGLDKDYKSIFENLGSSYYTYKDEYFRKNFPNMKDFHGLRDFYHLIGVTSRIFKNKLKNENYRKITEKRSLENIVAEAIERNFGGLKNSINSFKQIYNKISKSSLNIAQYNALDCILKNLSDSGKYTKGETEIKENQESKDNDPRERYLMIITNSSLAPLVKDLIEKDVQGRKVCLYLGSEFKDDQRSEVYSGSVLNRIQICMDQGNVMILRHLDVIYPNLYDLFNQNYTVINGKDYTRIALGSSNNSLSYVDKNFKSIVIIDDKEDLSKKETPFLNRFEKHILSIDNSLREEYKGIAGKFHSYLKDLITPQKPGTCQVDLEAQLINCGLDEIQAMIWEAQNKDINPAQMFDNIFPKIISTFSQDIVAFGKGSKLIKAQGGSGIYKAIVDIYKSQKHSNIVEFLREMSNTRNVIYTFSSILEKFRIPKEGVENKKINKVFKEEDIDSSILIGSLTVENELEKLLQNFYSNRKQICLVRFRPIDCDKLEQVKNFIDNYEVEREAKLERTRKLKNNDEENDEENEEENLKNKKVYFIFLIENTRIILSKDKKKNEEMRKNTLYQKALISHLSNFTQVFIDDINGEENNIGDFINLKTKDLLKNSLITNEKDFFTEKNLNEVFSKFLFSSGGKDSSIEKKFIEVLKEDENKRKWVTDLVYNDLEKKDLISLTFSDKDSLIFEEEFTCYFDFLKGYINYIFNFTFEIIIFEFAKHFTLIPFFFSPLTEDEKIRGLINDFAKKIDFKKSRCIHKVGGNKQDIILNIKFPFSIKHFKDIIKYVDIIKDDFLDKEQEIRFDMEDVSEDRYDDIRNQFETLHEKNQFENVLTEFKKSDFFKKFIVNNKINEKYYPFLKSDFYQIFLDKVDKTIQVEQVEMIFEFLLKYRFENSLTNDFLSLSKIILYSISNEKALRIICDVFFVMEKVIADFKNKIDAHCTRNERRLTALYNPEKNPLKAKINKHYRLLLDGIIDYILNEKELFGQGVQEVFDLTNSIKLIYPRIGELSNLYNLELSSYLGLNSAINAFDLLSKTKNGQLVVEFIQNYRKVENTKGIQDQFDFLKTNCGSFEEFPQKYISIVIADYEQNQKEDLCSQIVRIILDNNNIIDQCKRFLPYIFKDISLKPEMISDGLGENNCLENFLKFTEETSTPIKLLNDSKNERIDEILILFFENEINSYFSKNNQDQDENIPDPLSSELSLKYFEKCIKYLNDFYEKKEQNNAKLGKLYSIAYIKIYANLYVDKTFNVPEPSKDSENVNRVITGSEMTTPRKTIMFYFLKLFKERCTDYEAFASLNWEKRNMLWVSSDFKLKEDSEKAEKTGINFLFIDMDKMNSYNELVKLFDNYFVTTFPSVEKSKEKWNKQNLSIMCNIFINKIFSNMYKEEFLKTKEYRDFSNWISRTIEGSDLNPSTKQLMNLFCIESKYKETMVTRKLNAIKHEAMLYCFKLALEASNINNNNFYKELSNGNLNVIDTSFVPGGEPVHNLLINSYKEMVPYLQSVQPPYAAYLCSCGFFYQIPPCGYPVDESPCPICGQTIGGRSHNIHIRPGHIRVFIDQHHQTESLKHHYGIDPPFKYLNQIKEEVDQLIKNEKVGVQEVPFSFFSDNSKTVRELDQVSYRLLSLTFYSILFYITEAGIVNQANITKYLCKKKTCFDMVFENFKLLDKNLVAKGVGNTRIFFSMIFGKFINLLSNCPPMNSIENRKTFENQVKSLVEESMKNYQQYFEKYSEENQKLLKMPKNSEKSIICELVDPRTLDEEQFPFLRHFMVTSYPNLKDVSELLKGIENKHEKYPVLSSYFDKLEEVKQLKSLLKINPFANDMIENCNNIITRGEARKEKISDWLRKANNPQYEKEFEEFKEGWDDITKYMTDNQFEIKYQCRPDLKGIEMNKDRAISYCLNDIGELNYGMYLASFYSKFIGIQNGFLETIINNPNSSKKFYCFKETIKSKILVQKATKAETLDFDEEHINFNDLISIYSYRDCFDNNNNFIYSNYKNIAYQLDNLEEELGKAILSGKKQFSETLKFVTYKFEGYVGDNSSVLEGYNNKYEKKELTEDQKEKLAEYFKGKESEKILFGIQSIIFYIQKDNHISTEKVHEILSELRSFYKIAPSCLELFENFKAMTLSHLIPIYEYAEYLSYSAIKENINPEFHEPLETKDKEKLMVYYRGKKDLLITKEILASAVRKFNSRYLSGTRSDSDLNKEENIFIFLQNKSDIWEKRIFQDDNFEIEFAVFTEQIQIPLTYAISIYDELGGDSSLYQIKKKKGAFAKFK